jgi:DNA-binding beta-propeller fold protein YncE
MGISTYNTTHRSNIFTTYLAVLAFILSLGLLNTPSASAYTFSFKIPIGEPTLTSPVDVAVDSIGNIYVTSTQNSQVVKFSPAGVELMRIGSFGSADGQFINPFGVAVDSLDNIIVSDLGNNRIQVFNSARVHQLSFGSSGIADGQFNGPRGVAVDSSDNIIVVDFGKQPYTSIYSSRTSSTRRWTST